MLPSMNRFFSSPNRIQYLIIMILFYVLVVLASILLPTQSQPKCNVASFPSTLPLVTNQSLPLDLNDYFQGSNLTFRLSSSDASLVLSPKYSIQSVSHNVGTILSISTSTQIFTMLGKTSSGIYFVYYAPIEDPGSLSARQLPQTVTQCLDHSISPDSFTVTVSCSLSSNLQKFALAHTILKQQQQIWDVYESRKLVPIFKSTSVLYLSNTFLCAIIEQDIDMLGGNSYVQLWDMKYGRMVGVYDRVFFNLQELNIIDAKVMPQTNVLYLLDYFTGIYHLQLQFDKLVRLGTVIQLPLYSRIAVVGDNSLIVSRKGVLAEMANVDQKGGAIFKYQSIVNEQANQLIVSKEYIALYFSRKVVVYLRGMISPYFTLTFSSQAGKVRAYFIHQKSLIQCQSTIPSQTEPSATGDTEIQTIKLSHPTLKIEPHSLSAPLTITALSTINGQQATCNLSFSITRTSMDSYSIFDNGYSRNGTQFIYMNRPGRANIQLDLYGMGPNLQYQVQIINTRIPLKTQIHKISPLNNSQFYNPDKIIPEKIYFSQECLSTYSHCPLILDSSSQPFIFIFDCLFRSNFQLTLLGINCSPKRKEFKIDRFSYFKLFQSLQTPSIAYTASVIQSKTNQTLIMSIQNNGDNYTVVGRLNIKGDNKYGENNISQIHFNVDEKLIYILLKNRKTIQIYKIVEKSGIFDSQSPQNDVDFVLSYQINVASFVQTLYFAPQNFQIDSQGLLWVHNQDQILSLKVDIQEKSVKVISVINVYDIHKKIYNDNYTLGYNYTFKIVQKQHKGSSINFNTMGKKFLAIADAPSVLFSCQLDNIHLNVDDVNLCRKLPTFNQKLSSSHIQVLSGDQISVQLYSSTKLIKIVQIYSLGELSTISTPYQQIPCKNDSQLVYFRTNSQQPVIMTFSTALNYTFVEHFGIWTTPKMSFSLQNSLTPLPATQDIVLLGVYNDEDRIRHQLVVGIANYPENLTRGNKYPYGRVRAQSDDIYIEIDTRQWFVGNVLQTFYICDDCQMYDPSDPYIQVRPKIWKKDEIQIPGADAIYILPTSNREPERNNKIGIIKNNAIYLMDYQKHQVSTLIALTTHPEDKIQQIQIDFSNQIIVALVRQFSSSQYKIITYSMSSSKGFILDELLLPPSIQFIYNMQYKQNVVVLTQYNNIYVISIDRSGLIYVVDIISQQQLGGLICWGQFLYNQNATDNATVQHTYTIIVTQCSTGISLITFTINPNKPDTISIINKQSIDFKEYLHGINVRLPTDASFKRSISNYVQPSRLQKNQIKMFTLVNNFHSFYWVLTLKNQIIVTKLSLVSMMHRYGDFSTIDQFSISQDQRYVTLTYYGFYEGQNQYIHALYDLMDYSENSKSLDNFTNCFILQVIAFSEDHQLKFVHTNPEPDFANFSQETQTIGVGLVDGGGKINVYSIKNKFRALIHNHQSLQSQTVYILSYTPVSNINIELYIHGIDRVVWQIWEILVLILVISIVGSIVLYIGKIFWQQQQQKKKLVPLMTDFAEYQTDNLSASNSSEQHQDQGQQKEQDMIQIKRDKGEEQGDIGEEKDQLNINQSVRQSVNV